MKYKLMAVDIDGTLINSSGEFTEKTQSAIKAGVKKGLVFTIATGRPIQGVEHFSRTLGLDMPFITYNGAMVVMGRSRKILYERNLSSCDAKSIIELGIQYGVSVMIWKDNGLYVTRLDERAEKYKQISHVEPVLATDTEELTRNGATKVLWYDEIEKIKKLRDEIKPLMRETIDYYTSRPYFLEFVDSRASKAVALEKIGACYGITRDEMIAVGDGFNDISMIEYAGLGVAMANADDEVREKADYITLSNDEDGVAHVIEKFILEG